MENIKDAAAELASSNGYSLKAVRIDVTEWCRQVNGDAQEASQFEWLPVVPLKNPIHKFTTRVVQ